MTTVHSSYTEQSRQAYMLQKLLPKVASVHVRSGPRMFCLRLLKSECFRLAAESESNCKSEYYDCGAKKHLQRVYYAIVTRYDYKRSICRDCDPSQEDASLHDDDGGSRRKRSGALVKTLRDQ